MKRILVPLDFSEASVQALREAEILGEKFGASLLLLHVVEKAPFMSDMRNVPLAMSEDEVVEKSKVDLTLLARRELKEKMPFEVHVCVGKAHHEITEAAKKIGADLIVISTHGYSGLKHTLLGSTTERVVRHAPCAVFVIRKPE
jgi:nucleotide-binding universal stress UspA family protein